MAKKKNFGDEMIKGMEEFIETIKEGKKINVTITEVTREETPDGPLHTFKTIRKRKNDTT